MREKAVEIEQLSHVYVNGKGAFLALKDIHFDVQRGEFISLVGPSGCGKTTLLSLISGLMKPTQGSVKLGGKTVVKPTPRVGYMLQQDYLFPWRTIGRNVSIGLELLGRLDQASFRLIDELLSELGLAGQASRYPHQLSGGMRQRVALARTLASDPDLLLLDEPFSALDYQTKLQMEDLVSEALKARGKTALLVTHDLSEAIAMSDRIIVLAPNPGRILTEIVVPETIRAEKPFYAREQEGFQALFRQLWGLFEEMNAEKEEGSEGGE